MHTDLSSTEQEKFFETAPTTGEHESACHLQLLYALKIQFFSLVTVVSRNKFLAIKIIIRSRKYFSWVNNYPMTIFYFN